MWKIDFIVVNNLSKHNTDRFCCKIISFELLYDFISGRKSNRKLKICRYGSSVWILRILKVSSQSRQKYNKNRTYVFFISDIEICGLDFREGMSPRPPPKCSKDSSGCLLCRSEPFWFYSKTVKSYGRKHFRKISFFRPFATLSRSRFE